jgi:pimeloyl-ACP methyl ester carboxylesterase
MMFSLKKWMPSLSLIFALAHANASATLAKISKQKPVFVLVHGALFSSSGWSKVQSLLQNRGFNVVTLDVPGRGNDGIDPISIQIQSAAEKVCKVVQLQDRPVVLVGHSQGGALITQATESCRSKIQSLVYMAAVVPLSGEIAFEGLHPERDNTFPKCVENQPETGIFKLKKEGPLEESFFQDLRAIDPIQADAALATMVSEPMGIGTTPLSYNQKLFQKIPKFYIEAAEDRILSLETQRRFQVSTPMKKVYSIKSGHSPFLSQPKAVVDALVDLASK